MDKTCCVCGKIFTQDQRCELCPNCRICENCTENECAGGKSSNIPSDKQATERIQELEARLEGVLLENEGLEENLTMKRIIVQGLQDTIADLPKQLMGIMENMVSKEAYAALEKNAISWEKRARMAEEKLKNIQKILKFIALDE